ncbi:MAG: BolA family transcriptional regulator [Proteobacteria bacterium]|nr:BolA family transcriptional regulator [Pseudomonadota bacterium]
MTGGIVVGDKATRDARIRAALAVLAPVEIELIDEGHKHVGHEGARHGHGHYALRIVAECFRGLPPIACHRKVHAALGDLLRTDIHAISIHASAPLR